MSWFKNLKIRSKLMLCFAIMAVLAAVVGIVGIANLNKIDEADSMLYERVTVPTTQLMDMAVAYQRMRVNVREVILSSSTDEVKQFAAKIDDIRKQLHESADVFEKTLLTDAGRQTYKDFIAKDNSYDPVVDKVVSLCLAGRNKEALVYSRSQLAVATAEQDALDKLKDLKTKVGKETAESNDALGISSRKTMIVLLVFAVVIAVSMGMFVAKMIGNPIANLAASASQMAEGDLTATFNSDTKDEIGELGKTLDGMSANLRKMFKDVAEGVQTLASSSTELSSISEMMTSGAEETSSKSNTVAAATEEMSVSTTSVAASMEQATSNLNTVATATEEMTATIGEIASNSEKARTITGEATRQADRVSSMMQELGQAAQDIGKVTETITSISAQTNLLALNATIEAARAGAAGKGFAVVANEIKELAQQTAAATEDIKTKVSGIQTSTSGTVADIEKIAQVIRDVSDIVSSIAGAIEEQSVVTKDIAGNIAQASLGVRDANERVAQTASVSQSIAQDISGVNQSASDISSSSTQVQSSAQELSQLAEQLKSMVARFKLENGHGGANDYGMSDSSMGSSRQYRKAA